MAKHRGRFSELKAIVAGLGYRGEWSGDDEKRVFRAHDGAVLNWWPSTGTCQTQGPGNARVALDAAISQALSERAAEPVPPRAKSPPSTHPSSQTDGISRRVFVVHGHDKQALEQLQLVLLQLNLDPFVLIDTSGQGLTIIEAIENEIESTSTGERFGIVLLTPDDMGYRKGQDPEDAEPRARQNVVMEMGMLIAAFGRRRVAILKKPDVVVPSDASGIIYLRFENHVKEAAPKLCKRLSEAGFTLDAAAVAKVCA